MNSPNALKMLVSTRMSKDVPFMGQKLKIQKITVGEVREIRSVASAVEAENKDDLSLDVLIKIIRLAVPDASQLEDKDFETFPIDELQKLSTEIMTYSGFGDAKK